MNMHEFNNLKVGDKVYDNKAGWGRHFIVTEAVSGDYKSLVAVRSVVVDTNTYHLFDVNAAVADKGKEEKDTDGLVFVLKPRYLTHKNKFENFRFGNSPNSSLSAKEIMRVLHQAKTQQPCHRAPTFYGVALLKILNYLANKVYHNFRDQGGLTKTQYVDYIKSICTNLVSELVTESSDFFQQHKNITGIYPMVGLFRELNSEDCDNLFDLLIVKQ